MGPIYVRQIRQITHHKLVRTVPLNIIKVTLNKMGRHNLKGNPKLFTCTAEDRQKSFHPKFEGSMYLNKFLQLQTYIKAQLFLYTKVITKEDH